MNTLVFLVNELQNPRILYDSGLPLNFISFGLIKGKLYTQYRNLTTFIVTPDIDISKPYLNKVVYGTLFSCKDFFFHSRVLDAHHVCSLSLLGKNHPFDFQHRESRQITPITFNSINELDRIMYKEKEPINAEVYLGNLENPKISKRLKPPCRINNGVHEGLIRLFRRLKYEYE